MKSAQKELAVRAHDVQKKSAHSKGLINIVRSMSKSRHLDRSDTGGILACGVVAVCRHYVRSDCRFDYFREFLVEDGPLASVFKFTEYGQKLKVPIYAINPKPRS